MQTNYCLSTTSDLSQIPLETTGSGGFQLRLHCKPGLFQFSVVADARNFDWDELYFDLHLYGNTGQRTGPWDFNFLDKNKPLVPSYWVSLNGERLGLWYFQRVSIEDISHKRFRGRAAFWIKEAGEITLEFEPYRAMPIEWIGALWETDPEDTLEAQASQRIQNTKLPADDWATPEFWQQQRQCLTTTHAAFRELLERAFDWLGKKSDFLVEDLPLLLAAHGLGRRDTGLAEALDLIDRKIAEPHWGNPREDGYGHNGDMGAAYALCNLAWAYRAIGEQLGESRAAKLRDKLKLQAQRFLDLALLQRDYWGGSVLQDHGWRSFMLLGTAVLHLVGIIPETEGWLSYVLPRVERALAAMPRDGVIPQSSYSSLSLYLHEAALYRDALLSATGTDIYDQAPFHAVVDYVAQVVRESESVMIVAAYNIGGVVPFIGGNAFLNQIATKYRDERAASLQHLLLQTSETHFPLSIQAFGYYHGILQGFFSYDPAVQLLTTLPPTKPLAYFQDSGFIHYHDSKADITLSLRLAPWLGYHAARMVSGPCDAMQGSPGDGHFIVARGATPLLATPDGGYSLQSAICSCLLIDGKGQYGDVGYPMSIPSWKDRGAHVESAQWDSATQSGRIRLNLAPAYAAESGVISYIREFRLEASHIICRDLIELDAPRCLSWLFQGKRDNGIALENQLVCRLGGENGIVLEAKPIGCDLTAAIHETPVVWSYSGSFKFFDHVRFDTTEPVATAAIDFVITW